MHDSSELELVRAADALHADICRRQRRLLALIAQMDERCSWHDEGARDMAHWLYLRYGISSWKAERWIAAAHALEQLPRTAAAFESGELAIDKVVELTRLVTPQTERSLLPWAKQVASGEIRAEAERARRLLEDTRSAHRARSLRWYPSEDGASLGLSAELPAAEGAIVMKTIDRMAAQVPILPGDNEWDVDARRADALVALCSEHAAADPDPDRATIVVHAPLEMLAPRDLSSDHRPGGSPASGGVTVEGGPAIHAETLRRLACDARIQIVLEDSAGQPLKLGRLSREPSPAMLRLLRHRDKTCRFPGCGWRRSTNAHHIVWWSRGGRTDIQNLVLLCAFHHRLVHEHGWRITRTADNAVEWTQPDGVRYRAGPAPPRCTSLTKNADYDDDDDGRGYPDARRGSLPTNRRVQALAV